MPSKSSEYSIASEREDWNAHPMLKSRCIDMINNAFVVHAGGGSSYHIARDIRGQKKSKRDSVRMRISNWPVV